MTDWKQPWTDSTHEDETRFRDHILCCDLTISFPNENGDFGRVGHVGVSHYVLQTSSGDLEASFSNGGFLRGRLVGEDGASTLIDITSIDMCLGFMLGVREGSRDAFPSMP